MAGERVAYPLRIAGAVMEAVKRTASSDLRSANAQVEVLLREALHARGIKVASEAPSGDAKAMEAGDAAG